MQHTFIRVSGLVWILAGMTFWLGWVLMPELASPDALQLLDLVSDHRERVWWSGMVHLLASLLFMAGIIGIQSDRRMSRSKTTRVGAILTGFGAIGIGLEAFFHLVAYYLTAPGVHLSAVAEPMRQLQTQGMFFLIPLLLALFFGGGTYTAGFYHVDATSPWAKRMFLIGLAWALFGGMAAVQLGWPRQPVVMGFFSFLSLGYIWGGFELLFKFRPDQGPEKCRV